MNSRTLQWATLFAVSSLLVACSSSVTPAIDAATVDGSVADVGVDIGMPSDRSAVDVGSACGTVSEGATCSEEGRTCGGPCLDPCQFCNIFQCTSGRWGQLMVFPRPCTDAGAADAAASMAGARMLWQGPGGFAGTGPAVMVDGDGTVRVWETTTGVELASPSAPTRTLRVTVAAAADLFARWDRADRSALPHPGPVTDCYGRVSYLPCMAPGCRVETVTFGVAAQLSPEMNPVRQWFEETLIGEMSAAYPRTYCDF